MVGVSESEGLGWELDQIHGHGYLDKTLIIVPPGLTTRINEVEARSARAGLTIDGAADQHSEQEPPLDVRRHLLACWKNSSGVATIACCARLTELDYELALRLFMTEAMDRRQLDAQ